MNSVKNTIRQAFRVQISQVYLRTHIALKMIRAYNSIPQITQNGHRCVEVPWSVPDSTGSQPIGPGDSLHDGNTSTNQQRKPVAPTVAA